MIFDLLIEKGAMPIGLGARDTLRLEASLPLYGHELGEDPEGNEIPIFACGLSKFAVSSSPLKGNFVGKGPLLTQFEALKKIADRDYSQIKNLPRLVRPVALTGKGLARAGFKVFYEDKHVGFVTSGTMVPFWEYQGEGIESDMSGENGRRAICLALLDSDLIDGDKIQIEIRGKMTDAVIVPYHMRSEAPPAARAITYEMLRMEKQEIKENEILEKVSSLADKAATNTIWRQQECINLIPSEQTMSPMTRLLSIQDPVGRYAEHKPVKAFSEADVFYYQGTDFIAEVEKLLVNEFRKYLGCEEAEPALSRVRWPIQPYSAQWLIILTGWTEKMNRGESEKY